MLRPPAAAWRPRAAGASARARPPGAGAQDARGSLVRGAPASMLSALVRSRTTAYQAHCNVALQALPLPLAEQRPRQHFLADTYPGVQETQWDRARVILRFR